MVVEISEHQEIESLETIFPGWKVPQLGENAIMEKVGNEYSVKSFSESWNALVGSK